VFDRVHCGWPLTPRFGHRSHLRTAEFAKTRASPRQLFPRSGRARAEGSDSRLPKSPFTSVDLGQRPQPLCSCSRNSRGALLGILRAPAVLVSRQDATPVPSQYHGNGRLSLQSGFQEQRIQPLKTRSAWVQAGRKRLIGVYLGKPLPHFGRGDLGDISTPSQAIGRAP